MDSEYLTTGQMAKLHGVSKRTLIFYDNIGLFRPERKDGHDFRWYSYRQSPELELILSLAQMGMELKEIKRFVQNRTPESILELLENQQKSINQKIKQWSAMRDTINNQICVLRDGLEVRTNEIYTEMQEDEYLLATPILNDENIEEVYKAYSDMLSSTIQAHTFCFVSGSILAEDTWRMSEYERYYRYYVKLPRKIKSPYCTIKPGGEYLCMNWQGNWNNMGQAFSFIKEYTFENKIPVCGDVYADSLIDGFSSLNEDTYVTKIMIKTVRCTLAGFNPSY